jgi:hypothetical protein
MTLSIKLCEIKRIENQMSFIQQSRFYTNKYLIEEKKTENIWGKKQQNRGLDFL